MTLEAGDRFGSYEVVANLGAGGMGEVWRARDQRLDRDVALKVLPGETLADDKARQRLLREAKLAAKLNHPNVCTIHEVGEADGQTYIAMELVAGQPLSSRLASGRLPPDEVARLGVQLADALEHAHQHGVVHRDFKSPNVVITPEGRAKVLDFGLAKQMVPKELDDTAGATEALLTQPGMIVGTLAYMAPEQLRGLPADERSDVWALGVVLYEMVTGVRPFTGNSGFELTSAILSQPPRALPSGVSPILATIVERCLAKEPAQRYQRAGEVRSALEALQSGSAPSAWPRWRSTLVSGRRYLAVVVVAVVIAILVGLGVGGVRERLPAGASAERSVRMAVLPFANLSGDPEQDYLSDGITQELITQLGRLHPQNLGVIARSSVLRYKAGDTPLDQIGRELDVDYVLEGSARLEDHRVHIAAELIHVQDQTQLWAESYERELAGILSLQREMARDVAEHLDLGMTPDQEASLTTGRTVNPEVYQTYLRGKFYVSQGTPESFEKGMRYLHQAVEIDPAEPLAYAGLAEGYITLGHGGAELLDAFPRARAAAEQALKLDPEMAEAVGVLAHVALYYDWDWSKSEELFQRSLELNSSLAVTHYHYAWYLALFDRLEEAIVEHKLARDYDPLQPLFTCWLGGLYIFAGRYEEAVVEANKALELNPRHGWSFFVRRLADSKMGRHQEAIDTARQYIEVWPQYGTMELVTAYALAGQRERALEVLATLDVPKNRPHRLALMYLALEDRDAALSVLEAAYESHHVTLPWIRVGGFGLEPLYDEPRFQDLLRRMNLPLPSS